MSSTAPAIALTGLRKTFGSGTGAVTAVDDVDLEVQDGEFFAMLGPSGSGKTTVLRMIAGFELPTAGSIVLGGTDVTHVPPFRRDVNTVFQDYALFPHLSVADNVAYGLRVRGTPSGDVAPRVREALATVRLDGFGDRRPSQLSGGQRQRVALARALVNRPRVLLLDEPLGALDLKLREQMQSELTSIQRDVGITFVFVTHDQTEALTMSDRLAVFNQGRIEQLGPPEEVYERPATPFVAGFVGSSNLLPPEASRRLIGQAATFSVRPEKITIMGADQPAAGDDDQVVTHGTVQDVAYGGATSRVTVLLGGPEGAVLDILRRNDFDQGVDDATPGVLVQLRWSRRHCVRLEDQSSAAVPPESV